MLTIRPFHPTDADYVAFVAVNNACWPDNPKTADEEKHADANRNPDHFLQRVVGEHSGEIVATGECGATFWLDEPDQYYWHFNFLPEYANRGYEQQMYDYLMTILVRQNPCQFFVGMRDDKVQQIQFIEARGYHLIQTEPTSYLDVAAFDDAPFLDIMTHVQQMDIQFFSVRHLQQIDADWLLKLWNLQWAIKQDVPRAGQATREPFATFKQRVNDPHQYDANAHFVAVHQAKGEAHTVGDYIGMTRLTYNKVDPTIGATHLTGVVRNFRRKGIATALKVHAIRTARAQGVRRINTMNNETNPMLNLNLRLGFQPGPAWRYYQKKL